MKDRSDNVTSQASQLIKASQSIDYKRILAHDKNEVARLNLVLQQLRNGAVAHVEPLENYAQKPVVVWGENLDQNERRQLLLDALTAESFDDRLDKVYSSFSKERVIHIKQVPHRRGLPRFDLVLAPDFAPAAGFHGVFIAGNAVLSGVLVSDAQQSPGDWQILKRKTFSSLEEMVEIVTLIAAGFD